MATLVHVKCLTPFIIFQKVKLQVSLYLAPSLSLLSLTLTFSHSLSHTHSLSQSLSFSLSLSHTHTHTYTCKMCCSFSLKKTLVKKNINGSISFVSLFFYTYENFASLICPSCCRCPFRCSSSSYQLESLSFTPSQYVCNRC